MHRTGNGAPARARGDQPGIFLGQDDIAEGEGLGWMLEGIEQSQQVQHIAIEPGLLQHGLPADIG
ncbi:hypothetical protein D3C72_2241590 [compost metagenome]